MKYRIVRYVHLERDSQLTETGYHLGYRDTLQESLELIISDMSTNKGIISKYEISVDDNLMNVVGIIRSEG